MNILRRRNFLIFSFNLLAANATVYLVGSVLQGVDGSLVAGAKTCGCTCGYVDGYCGYTGPTNYGGYEFGDCGTQHCGGNGQAICDCSTYPP